MIIELATERNIDDWMALVGKVKGSFPGLETEKAMAEHRETVLEFMEKGCAICAKEDGRIVGILLFSKETNMLCFLAVDAEYRRAHIGSKMFSYMLNLMDAGKDITVTTYRAEAHEGIPARKFYQRMGFTEGKLTEEFDSPVQEFVLKRSKEI